MPVVRPGAADKWARRAAVAGPDYLAGVQAPRRPWAATTVAAAASWGAGVQAAVAAKSFERGVGAAGDAKWQAKAAGKGAQRFGPGVADAQPDYQKGVQPYFDVIANVQLTARGPKGSPQNLNRVAQIANALHAKKMAGGGR
jgi:hypothetical protein